MDSFRLWQDDYRREVEEVLGQLKRAPQTLSDAVIPPAGALQELEKAKNELAQLRADLTAAQRALEVRSAELAEESRRREHLKDLAVKLNWTVQRLDGE